MSNLPDVTKDISVRQHRAIPKVLSHPSIEAGCKAAKIAVSTWYGWRKSAAFNEAVKLWERAIFSESLERAVAGTVEAVDSLRELLRDPDKHVRLQAIQCYLGYALKVNQTLNVSREIAELKKLVGLKK